MRPLGFVGGAAAPVASALCRLITTDDRFEMVSGQLIHDAGMDVAGQPLLPAADWYSRPEAVAQRID